MARFQTFEQYWDSLTQDGRKLLSQSSGLNHNFLWQVARGYRRAGPKTMAALAKVDPTITPQLLRPELYQ